MQEGNVLHLSVSHSVQRWGRAWGVGGVQGGEGMHGGSMAGGHTWWEHGRDIHGGGMAGGIHGGGMAGGHTWWGHGRGAYMVGAWQGAHMVGAWQEGMHLGDTASEAGGMHPTGMHSCYGIVSG